MVTIYKFYLSIFLSSCRSSSIITDDDSCKSQLEIGRVSVALFTHNGMLHQQPDLSMKQGVPFDLPESNYHVGPSHTKPGRPSGSYWAYQLSHGRVYTSCLINVIFARVIGPATR